MERGRVNNNQANVLLMFDNLITMEELLCMLKGQWSKKTIYNWIAREGFPAKKIRGKWWFPKTDVIQWLERSGG